MLNLISLSDQREAISDPSYRHDKRILPSLPIHADTYADVALSLSPFAISATTGPTVKPSHQNDVFTERTTMMFSCVIPVIES